MKRHNTIQYYIHYLRCIRPIPEDVNERIKYEQQIKKDAEELADEYLRLENDYNYSDFHNKQ